MANQRRKGVSTLLLAINQVLLLIKSYACFSCALNCKYVAAGSVSISTIVAETPLKQQRENLDMNSNKSIQRGEERGKRHHPCGQNARRWKVFSFFIGIFPSTKNWTENKWISRRQKKWLQNSYSTWFIWWWMAAHEADSRCPQITLNYIRREESIHKRNPFSVWLFFLLTVSLSFALSLALSFFRSHAVFSMLHLSFAIMGSHA